MSLIDTLKDGVQRFFPAKSGQAHPSTSMSGGIGSGHGMVPFEDDVSLLFPLRGWVMKHSRTRYSDDRLKTNDRSPFFSNLFQLSCSGLHGQRRELSSEMGCRPMYACFSFSSNKIQLIHLICQLDYPDFPFSSHWH
jgi:hypothetical protein